MTTDSEASSRFERLNTWALWAQVVTAVAAVIGIAVAINHGNRVLEESRKSRALSSAPHLGFVLRSGTAEGLMVRSSGIDYRKLFDDDNPLEEVGFIRNYGAGTALDVTITWSIEETHGDISLEDGQVAFTHTPHPRNLMPGESISITELPDLQWDAKFDIFGNVVVEFRDQNGETHQEVQHFCLSCLGRLPGQSHDTSPVVVSMGELALKNRDRWIARDQ